MISLAAYVEYDPETNLYVGIVPSLRGAHTQAETLDELNKNLREVIELCLEEDRDALSGHRFVGLQQVEVDI